MFCSKVKQRIGAEIPNVDNQKLEPMVHLCRHIFLSKMEFSGTGYLSLYDAEPIVFTAMLADVSVYIL